MIWGGLRSVWADFFLYWKTKCLCWRFKNTLHAMQKPVFHQVLTPGPQKDRSDLRGCASGSRYCFGSAFLFQNGPFADVRPGPLSDALHPDGGFEPGPAWPAGIGPTGLYVLRTDP